MNIFQMSTRIIAAIIVVLTLCLSVPVAGQDQAKKSVPAQPKGDSAPNMETQVHSLKHANAVELAEVLGRAYVQGKNDGRVVAEPRTNTVIVVAPPTEMALIRELIKQIDRPAPADDLTRQQLAIMQLRSAEPNEAFESALNLILGKHQYAIDRVRKTIVVNADEPLKAKVEALVARLDAESPARAPQDVQIRVVWLINDGEQEDKKSPPPPEDVKDVLPALAKMGITRPGLAAQFLVTVTSDQDFRVHGRAAMTWMTTGGIHISADGRYAEMKSGPELRISLRGKLEPEGEFLSLDSTISAPMGQFIVLGMTPFYQTTSVFVIQVLPKGAKSATPKR